MDIRNDTSLLHRVALISGALGSIGQAIAFELGRRGASLAVADVRSSEEGAPFVQQCEKEGIRTTYRQVDVSRGDEVSAWIRAAEEELGVASIVVPCAAIVSRADLRTIDAGIWRNELQINLDGSFHVAQQAALRMIAHGTHGSIVFLGSWVAERPHPRIVTYCVGKAALRMLMKCMALDLASAGILVNEVAPGFVDAGLTGETLKTDPGRRATLVGQTPIGRLIGADEVAFHVANLCDQRSSGVTGTTLLLDGGLSLGGL